MVACRYGISLLLLNFISHSKRNSISTSTYVLSSNYLAPVVQRLDNTIHRINHYPADSVVCFVKTYPLDSDLTGG